MKTILGIITVAILAFGLGTLLPWWSIAIAGFIGGLVFSQKAFQAFLIGFLGTGLLWLILGWSIDNANNSLLSTQVGNLLGDLSPLVLLLLSATIGAIISALASLTAHFGKQLFIKKVA